MFLVVGVMAALLSSRLWPTSPEDVPRAGGMTTLFNRSSHAFGQPAPGLTMAEVDKHRVGDIAFDAVFVTSPAKINPGLGPLFNNSSCGACHIKNGRGLPELGQALVRVSLSPTSKQVVSPRDGVVPVPNIGTQVRDHAIYGDQPDARVSLSWQTQSGQYPDGTDYQLRSPQLSLSQSDPQKPIPETVLTSLRIPPPVFGMGLLEVLPENTLQQLADPQDQDGDGISGRRNRVWDPDIRQTATGRFGLKANSPTLRHQVASAYSNDMGIANPMFLEASGRQDIDEETLEANVFYVQSLGVPARTMLDDLAVGRGEKLFDQANCAACHISTLKTGPAPIAALANQTIHPYTDLLLHDMGPGLADGRPDFVADGQEWRTSPLWGLGLTDTVLPYSGYLHDGRARSVEEAILWHSGEADAAKQQFMAMDIEDRRAMLKFLNSL
ncbi:MAG: di-heme oxidoredictase family protein [Cyanobacteria bacterium P01_G01_bin.38]